MSGGGGGGWGGGVGGGGGGGVWWDGGSCVHACLCVWAQMVGTRTFVLCMCISASASIVMLTIVFFMCSFFLTVILSPMGTDDLERECVGDFFCCC